MCYTIVLVSMHQAGLVQTQAEGTGDSPQKGVAVILAEVERTHGKASWHNATVFAGHLRPVYTGGSH